MSHKTTVLVITLLAVITAGMFMFSYLYKQASNTVTVDGQIVATSSPAVTDSLIDRVDGKHFFINGVHTITGEITLPTPCDLLMTEALIAESYPEQVTFVFDVVNTSETCAQVATIQRFKVEAKASKEANLAATFSGIRIPLNLIEAETAETPDSFELFIKG